MLENIGKRRLLLCLLCPIFSDMKINIYDVHIAIVMIK